jgi:5-methylcytosine-specific restriction endonuclease McrA
MRRAYYFSEAKMATKYSELLKDPRWKQRRDHIIKIKGSECSNCGSRKNLNVHHNWYIKDLMPWEYTDQQMTILCGCCHSRLHTKKNRLVKLLSEHCDELELEGLVMLMSNDEMRQALSAMCSLENLDRGLVRFSKLLSSMIHNLYNIQIAVMECHTKKGDHNVR